MMNAKAAWNKTKAKEIDWRKFGGTHGLVNHIFEAGIDIACLNRSYTTAFAIGRNDGKTDVDTTDVTQKHVDMFRKLGYEVTVEHRIVKTPRIVISWKKADNQKL